MTRFRWIAAVAISVTAATVHAQDYNNRLVNILGAYDVLLSVPLDEDVEDLPGDAWKVITAAVNQGFLRFTIDPENEGGLIEGASFVIDASSKTQYIVFAPGFIDYYSNNPNAVYARLTREFKSAAEFFLNPPVFYQRNRDPMTRFLMRMEAMKSEALFVRDRLAPKGDLIGPYEQFLIESLAADDLMSAALFIERASLPLAQGLELARLQFEETGDVEALRDIVIKSGVQIGLERQQIGVDFNAKIYPAAVATYSWLEFTPWIISRIHNRNSEGEPKNFEEILELETDYAKVRESLESLMELDFPVLEQVYRDTIKGFENS